MKGKKKEKKEMEFIKSVREKQLHNAYLSVTHKKYRNLQVMQEM